MPDKSGHLKKELSLFGVYTLATGATLSSGFFLLPGLAIREAGAAVFISYILAILPLLPGIICKIELATAMPRAGGEYYFIDRSLGPLFGTIAGLGTWLGLTLKTAFALIGISAYLGIFFPGIPMKSAEVAAALGFGVLNLFGASKSTSLQMKLVIGLLALLAWFLVKGATEINLSHFDGMWQRDGGQFWGILSTAGLVCVSFMGLTKVASVAEEVKNPERNLKLGIFLAIGTAIVVYGFGTFVLVGVASAERLSGSLTPVADVAESLLGHTGAVVMTVAAILAFLSVGNAGTLSASRYPLAMARDHLLPPVFRRLNGCNAPQNGILLTTGTIVLFLTVFDPSKIAKLASAFLLMLFALNCLAVIVMRESKIESYDPGYRCPWYPWVPIIGAISPFFFILFMGWLPIVFTFFVVTLGTIWYFYYARMRITRGGAIYHLFARIGRLQFAGLDAELRGILKEKGLRPDDPFEELVATSGTVEEGSSDTFEDYVRKASSYLADQLPIRAEELFKTFMNGTRIGATPVSKGVALPHMRLSDLKKPLMVLARSQTGVRVDVEMDFIKHAADQKIHAMIFLVSSEDNASQHLRILAQIAQRVDDEHFMRNWLDAETPQQLRETLLREEHYLEVVARRTGETEPLIDSMLRDLDFPQDILVALIRRGGDVVIPRGGTRVCENDVLTIVGGAESIRRIRRRFGKLRSGPG